IRHNIIGLATGPLGPDERAAARREVENALADGAVGLSSGMDYLPSRFGEIEEVADIARPLAAAGGPYVSHLRAYGPEVKAGLDELVAVGHRAGIRVHASHLWGAPADIQSAFKSADAAGVAVTYDMYPYRKSSTILAVLLLPAELQTRGPEHTLAALTDPRQRAELLGGKKLTDEVLQDLYLGCLPADAAQFAGQPFTRRAEGSSLSAGEWVLDLLVSTGLNVGAHLDRPSLTDEHLAWLAADDRQCAGSDGIYQGQHPHPRGYGALARRLSANAADAYGLRNRGRLASGMAADVCVIGPGGITDRAIYGAPQVQATGVDLVIVNGVITWRDGEPLADRFPGQLVS